MRFVSVVVASAALAAAASAQPFTYQGELNQSGSPVNTPHDFEFRVFNADSGGAQMGATTSLPALPVTNGRFTATVDPGAGVFTGLDAWLEIAVRAGGGGSYTTLSPRQKITAAPYAARALTEWWQPASPAILTNDPTRTRVLLNRTSRITTAEYFGFTAPVVDFTYGGMYINTPTANALPFYGYSTANGGRACWTAFQGSTQSWFVQNGGGVLTVENNGNVGVGIATGAAVAKLDVDGAVRASSHTFNAPQSRTLSLPGAAFRAADSSNPQIAENVSGGTYLNASVAAGALVAPLNLPDGCTITNITLYCYDNTTGALTLKLYRRPHGQFGAINEFLTPGSVNNGNIQTLSANGSLGVGNAANSYYLQVDCSDWNGPSTSVFSALVTYSVTTAD